MKKIRKYLVLFLILGLSFACGAYSEITDDGYKVKSGYNDSKNYIKDISNINDFINLYNQDKTSVVVIGQTECSHCLDYRPKVNRVAYTSGVKIYWIEYDKLDSASKYKFQSLNDSFKNFGTPYTIFIQNKEIKDEISGDVDATSLNKKLIKNNLIKKE